MDFSFFLYVVYDLGIGASDQQLMTATTHCGFVKVVKKYNLASFIR